MDIAVRILTLPISLAAIFVLVYLPGHFICQYFVKQLNRLERFYVDTVTGIVTAVFLFLVVGYLFSPQVVLLPLLLLSLQGALLCKWPVRFPSVKIAGEYFLLFLFFCLGIFATGWFMFRGAIIVSEGVYSAGTSYNDALWHLSLTAELKREFPPQIPTIAGVSLKNYHYFSDIVTSIISFVLPFDVRHLYFFHLPAFMTVLMGVAVIAITKRLSTLATVPMIAVFLTFFAGSFAYILPLFFGWRFNWHESSFWVSQTVSMGMNPPFIFSVPIFFCVLLLLNEYQQTKSKQVLWLVPPIIASLVGFKIYAFIIIIIGFTFFVLFQLTKEKAKALLLLYTYIVSLLLSYLLLQILKGPSTGSIFLFVPLWYMRAMVEHQDRVPIMDWVLREDTYRFEKNWFRIIQLKVYESIIFVVGNLGLRVLGLLVILKVFWSLFKGNTLIILLFFCLMPSFILPFLFVQNGTVASTIQFWYYTLLIMNIFTALVAGQFLQNKKRYVKVISYTLFIILAIPTTLHNIIINRNGHVVLDKNQYRGLTMLKNNTSQSTVILVPADLEQIDKAYVSAFSQRRTFVSYGQIAEITKATIDEKKQQANDFFDLSKVYDRKQFLSDANIEYVYDLQKEFDWRLLGLDLIYQNETVRIYKKNQTSGYNDAM